MAKYLGIKLVDAEEMTLDAFQAKYPGRVVNPVSGDCINGYCVTYPDGYQGWCPKEVFKEANIKNDKYLVNNLVTRLLELDTECTLQPVKCVQDNDGHWYVIPNYMEEAFYRDLENEIMIDLGHFDKKYGIYSTGGDLNLLQFYTTFYYD